MFEGSSSTPAGADRAVRRSCHHRAAVLALPLVIISLAAPLSTYASSRGPYIEQAELLPTGEIGNASPGTSIALSGDGQTALIGGPGDDEGQGAVWAFHRHGSTWTQQAKLTGLDEAGKGRFGQSVALSKDGRMALVGGPQDDAGIGAV